MHTTTPRAVSEAIRRLCHDLAPGAEPVFLAVTPAGSADVNDCFVVVERHVQAHGGSVCYGWQIWEWPGVMLEAEFHAVWRDHDGVLHDLTPKQLSVDRILFLPDPDRVYEGRQVSNVRRALSEDPDVAAFIAAADDEFELLNRGERATQHGKLHLDGAETEEWLAIQRRKAAAYERTVLKQRPSGRNAPCPCGSGKKFKNCHGRLGQAV